jgi:glycosyltransferase involved in cell wall biosynthesis
LNMPLAIAMIHQGSELYGSDRSFVTTLRALRLRYPDAKIEVVLPERGALVEHIAQYASRITYDSGGVLRRKRFKSRPLRTLCGVTTTWLRYRRMFRTFDICYVNTVVCVAAIAALGGRPGATYVHVREIPGAFASHVFKALLGFSRASLIYNSRATAAAFGLPGLVVHNGVDGFGVSALVVPRGSHALRLAIIGRINAWKGQQFVLNALQDLGRSLPVEVRIVGDVFAGYEEVLVNLRETANACSQRVDIESFTQDLAVHYAWADFVLVPSISPEPFGRVAAESFAVGRPVIASATGGLPEIVTDGETGFLFKPNDPEDFVRVVERALSMTDVAYERMATAARRKYVESFTIEAYMDAIAEAVLPLGGAKQPLHRAVLQRDEIR